MLHGNTGCGCAQTARRLALEWQAWVVRTSALRRAFVSVKGFYFQADVLGQPVTWLVPHALAQVPPTAGRSDALGLARLWPSASRSGHCRRTSHLLVGPALAGIHRAGCMQHCNNASKVRTSA